MNFPFRMCLLVGVSAAMLWGCANKGMWYQQGKGQVDFDRDEQECSLIASNFARQATISGNAEDPETYQLTFRGCLLAKGWSGSPPRNQMVSSGVEKESAIAEPLVVIDGNKVHAFGSLINIPNSFVTLSDSIQNFGSTRGQTVMFSGPQSTVITILAQKINDKANRFTATPYAINSPFFLYGQSVPRDREMMGRQRSIFCGVVNGEWVMGLGSYLLINGGERVTIIVTKMLSSPLSKPEPGFRLSSEQFAIVDGFEKEWTHWLVQEVTLPKRFWLSRIFRP